MANPGITLPPRPPPLGPPRRLVRDLSLSLARMLRAGVSLQESLATLARGGSGYVRLALEDVAREVDNGSGLGDALARHPRLFRPTETQIIRAAERTGDPSPSFEAIAEAIQGWLQARQALGRKAAYPMMVLLFSVLLLPIPKAMTSGSGAYVTTLLWNFGTLAAIAAGVVVGIPWLVRETPLGEHLRRLAWRLPWPGSIYRDHVHGTFYGVLARNLEAGLPVHDALRTAGGVTGDARTAGRADTASRSVGAGQELATALDDAGLVPSGERMIVLSGERAGTLPESLGAVAAHHRERTQRGLGRLVSVGGVILTIAVFVWVANGVLGAWRDLGQSSQEVYELIEEEMPYRLGP